MIEPICARAIKIEQREVQSLVDGKSIGLIKLSGLKRSELYRGFDSREMALRRDFMFVGRS